MAKYMGRMLEDCKLPPYPRLAQLSLQRMVLAWPDGHDEVFEGKVDGRTGCLALARGNRGARL